MLTVGSVKICYKEICYVGENAVIPYFQHCLSLDWNRSIQFVTK